MAGPDKNYYDILESLKEKIRIGRQKAASLVNTQLLGIYWEIGNTILQQQQKEGWGTKVIDRLTADLKTEFPDMKGLSVRNIKYMRAFAEAYPQFVQPVAAQIQTIEGHANPIVQATPAQLRNVTEKSQNQFVQGSLAQLSWYHHTTLLDKVKNAATRIFYVRKTIENGWSRNMMAHQIESGLHLRQGKAITNFELTLPKPQSDLAKETLKNPYVFDFLGVGEEMQERELEKALVQHIKRFMLELGRGFTYAGNQYNLRVEGDEYFLDLLFFNYHLDCFVVFELKVGEFKPEFAGKLNFYINTIDEQIKLPHHKQTIGVLLCKTPNETVVKYALKGIETPMGVTEYELTNALPKQLKAEMPTIEELEQEMEKEMEILRKPIDEKKSKLKEILSRIKGDEVKKEKDNTSLIYLFNEVLAKIKEHAEKILKEEMALFKEAWIARSLNGFSNKYAVAADFEAILLRGDINTMGLYLHLDGFAKAGTKAFSIYKNLQVNLDRYRYTIGPDRDKVWKEKLYHQQWTEEELYEVAEQWSELIIDEINRRLEQIA
jgi:predicted nuclease of restriction endonuclease-like (RecB) superfamily